MDENWTSDLLFSDLNSNWETNAVPHKILKDDYAVDKSDNTIAMWREGGSGHFTFDDPKTYIELTQMEQFDFEGGNCIEIGPGNGTFAKYLLDNYDISKYTILDAPISISEPKKTLEGYQNVEFITSDNYKEIFKTDYDLLIANNCLSETPEYYYKDIFNNIDAKKGFLIDGDRENVEFAKAFKKFMEQYQGYFWELTALMAPMNISDINGQRIKFNQGLPYKFYLVNK